MVENTQWIHEEQTPGRRLSFKIQKVIATKQSPYQLVEVVQTEDYGRMLLLDRLVMSNEHHEFIYHEMLAHLGLSRLPVGPKEVLIIGGGDGGTAREVLKDPQARVTLAELDGDVIDLSREHLPFATAALQDPRCEIRVGDGLEFLKSTDQLYDLILVDGADPIGPAAVLFSPEFLALVKAHLKKGGVAVTQSESPIEHLDWQRGFYRTAKRIFPALTMHWASIPTYPSGAWSFTVYLSEPTAPRDLGLNTLYYTRDLDLASQVFPPAFDCRLPNLT